MALVCLSPYVKVPGEHLIEDRRSLHPIMKFRGSPDSFAKRMLIQTCETHGFESVVQAMEEAGGKKKKNAGSVNKNMLAHYGALFKNGMTDIAIKDVPKEDTVLLLNYMYKGKMEIEDGVTLRKALMHAIRFNMGSLVDQIEKAFDFRHHSAILLYNLGEELGIHRYEDVVIEVFRECICSPKFPAALMASTPIPLLKRVLERGLVAESESEIADLLLRYLSAARAPIDEACAILNHLRFPQLRLSDIRKIEEFLFNEGASSQSVANLDRIKLIENVLGSNIPQSQLSKRGLSTLAYMLWMEKRYSENKSVLVLNGVRLNHQEKAHAYAKLKLHRDYDKLELPENFEMVTIGKTMYVNVKDEIFPSTNVNIQGFTVTDDNDISRLNNARIPLSFKQEISNKRLTADGSRLVLSFSISEKKHKKKHRLGYFETLPRINRTFNEVQISAELPDIVLATLFNEETLILTKTALVVVDRNGEAKSHGIAEADLQVNCVDMIVKGGLVLIYALCYAETTPYSQRDIIRAFDLEENRFITSPSGATLTCHLPQISSVFVTRYSTRLKRGEGHEWRARDSSTSAKVKLEESLFRFFDVGGKIHFVWTDTFNESGKVFHFGLLDVGTMTASILRKVFYVKSDESGAVSLSRDLIGLVPGYLLRNQNNTWLESKLREAATAVTAENLSEFREFLAFT